MRLRNQGDATKLYGFLSSNTQDFIEVYAMYVIGKVESGFLSSNTQDFIEVVGGGLIRLRAA